MITSEVYAMAVQILDVQPARKLMEGITERVKAGKCLHCEEKATRRGLCVNHYFAWRRAMAGLGKAEAREQEGKLIKAGKILPVNLSRQIKTPNLFRT